MEIVVNTVMALATQSPMILACLVFVIAAMLKVGRERGAILVLLGAVGLFLMTLASPIIYAAIMPRLLENVGMDNFERIYLVLNLTTNTAWAGAMVLISIGTFLRSPAVRQA